MPSTCTKPGPGPRRRRRWSAKLARVLALFAVAALVLTEPARIDLPLTSPAPDAPPFTSAVLPTPSLAPPLAPTPPSAPSPITTVAPLAIVAVASTTEREPIRSHRIPLPGPPYTSPGSDPSHLILRAADIPEENWTSGHRGVDLQATPGQTIVASRGGQVVFTGSVAGTPLVSIEHSEGLRTTYEPVHAVVSAGERVKRGQVIGMLADAAALPDTARRSPGLSWGAKWGSKGSYVDPVQLLGGVRVRLVPPPRRPRPATPDSTLRTRSRTFAGSPAGSFAVLCSSLSPGARVSLVEHGP